MKFNNSFKNFFFHNLNHKLTKNLFVSFTASYFYLKYHSKKLDCCGLIGYIGKDNHANDVCVEAIQVLQFRGYDSVGITTYNSQTKEFETTKFASEVPYLLDKNLSDDCIKKIVETVPKKHFPSNIGIGHTRWATHGKKIELNAHPHFDNSGKICIAHNGIIDNFKEIKLYLSEKQIEVKTETDSELIAQLIGMYYKEGNSFSDSVKFTLEKHLVGTFALVIMNLDFPNKLICARSGSPLLIGIGKDFYIVSSDCYAFQKYTSDYFKIDNQDIIELDWKSKITNVKIHKTKYEEIYKTPVLGYDHFMIQEIMEQPETIKRAMSFGSRFKNIKNDLFEVKLGGLEDQKEFLKKSKNIVVLATGTSFYASMFVGNILRKMDIFNTVQVIDVCEFDDNYLPKENPICVFVSQSGESKDLLVAVNFFILVR